MDKKKVHKCDLKGCERLFSTKYSLKRHIIKHADKKSYKCKHCPKAFVLP